MAESEPTQQAEQAEEKTVRRGRRAEAPQTSTAPAPPDVPVSQLITDSRAFTGHPPWAAAAALHDHDPDEMMGADAAKKEIEAWLKKPVEVAGKED